MSQQNSVRKRTRSQTFGKEEMQEGEPPISKRQIVEVNQAEQTQQNSSHQNKKEEGRKIKEIRKKLKKIQENTNQEDLSAKKQNQSKSIQAQQQKEKKKKKKHKQKDEKEQKKASQEAKTKKHRKKSEKKEKDNNSDEDVKQQEANKSIEKQKGEQKQKSKKKKKKHKRKQIQTEQQVKKPPESSMNAKEQEDNEKGGKKEKKDTDKKSKKSKKSKKDKKEKKKKSKKDESEPSSDSQSDQQDNEDQSQEQANQKTKKIKKEAKKRKGRKPQGPVKRKKASIFQQQQIINKKYRVKKKSTYLNKMSERAWGQLRAGPYRDVKKHTKTQQRKIIDSIVGDGPKKQTSNSQLINKQIQSVKIQNQQQKPQQQKQVTENEEKMQAEASRNDADSSDEQKKPKSKSKSKKKSEKDTVQDSGKNITDTTSTAASMKSKSSVKVQTKSKTKKKKKKESSSEESEDQNQAKIQHGEEAKTKSKSKKKKKKAKNNSDSSESEQQPRKKSKKKSVKKDVKHEASAKKTKVKQKKEEDIQFPKQESQKIIDLFAADGGNYPQMMKQLPGIRLKKVRLHLRMLFHRALDIITYQAQHRCLRKIKEWQSDQKIQIVRELHRIRSSNRLLSEANVLFREKMTALMRSYNDQTWMEKVTDTDIEYMYKKLQAFVRGYNTINRSKRSNNVSLTQSKQKQREQRYKFNKEVTRKPIICGGHLLSKSIKNEQKQQTQHSEFDDRSRNVLPQKLIEDWNRQEEKALCELYVKNQEADEVICQQLKKRFGPNIKWRDFQLLGRKIDQLIKYALIKLQNLTARPYCKQQRERQLQKKRTKLQQKLKRQNEHYNMNYYKQKLQTTSMFLYDNEIFQKEERLEYKHRIFKNLSLLQRQIFGHIESHRFKNTLVKILIDEFPMEEDVEAAVREAKKFAKWAREDERKSNISNIKNVFIGEREDRDFRDDDHNQDSIMADIQKIEITRKQGYMPQSTHYSEQVDQKSILFAQTASGRAQQPIQIQNDNDSVQVSDFEQPQSVRSHSNQQSNHGGEKFQKLQKLYQSLNTKPK